MYFIYSILLSLAFVMVLPLFILRREKYASGFRQRLGQYPPFHNDGREVIWLHCVSVGETNAARPLVEKLREVFPNHRLVISTTTKTGQELAQKIFADKADAIAYFPFDWKFSVRRALKNYRPSLVLLMETEIWPRFIHEAKLSGSKVAIVNGRLSQKSFDRYSRFRSCMSRVLDDVDLALMQGEADANRITNLGMDHSRTVTTGNMKFEYTVTAGDAEVTEQFRARFDVTPDKPLIIAASTHDPEERYVLESLEDQLGYSCRLMIAPRHPQRFDTVAHYLRESPYTFVRRSDPPSDKDKEADVVLLDTIGELRAAYPLAEIVFVGGSLIPHGGQSILEPAAEGKAIVTGPYTANFDSVVKEFLDHDAVLQTPQAPEDFQVSERLYEEFILLLEKKERRRELGANAAAVMRSANHNAVSDSVESLKRLFAASPP